MNRYSKLALLAALTVACGDTKKTNPPPADAGTTCDATKNFCDDDANGCHSNGDKRIGLGGTAAVHPVAVAVLSSAGPAYDVGDVTKFQVHVQDPLKLLINPNGPCVEQGTSPKFLAAITGQKNAGSWSVA